MLAIKRAVRIIGGQTEVAKLIGTRQSVVWNWVNRDQQAPAKYIRKISELTNGEVTVDELLADHENNHANAGK